MTAETSAQVRTCRGYECPSKFCCHIDCETPQVQVETVSGKLFADEIEETI